MKYAWSATMASIFERYNIKESDKKTDWHWNTLKLQMFAENWPLTTATWVWSSPRPCPGCWGCRTLASLTQRSTRSRGIYSSIKGYLFTYPWLIGRGEHSQWGEPGQARQAGGQPLAGHPCWLWLHGEEIEAARIHLKHNLQSLVTTDLDIFEAQKNHIPCSCPLLGILDSLIGSHQVETYLFQPLKVTFKFASDQLHFPRQLLRQSPGL